MEVLPTASPEGGGCKKDKEASPDRWLTDDADSAEEQWGWIVSRTDPTERDAESPAGG